jgi:hypothetical protein
LLVTTRFARTLAATLSLVLSAGASAYTTVDLFNSPGIPGTGGHYTVVGPCYCEEVAVFSPVHPLDPGTYDFGQVRDYWVQSGITPDGGPDQDVLYLLFSPVEIVGTYPYDFPAPSRDVYPMSTALCAQDDVACNASFEGAYLDSRLIITVPQGQYDVQVGFIGPYLYTPPVPEPAAAATLLLGLTLAAAASRRRVQGRRAG